MLNFFQFLTLRENQDFQNNRNSLSKYKPSIKKSKKFHAVRNVMKNAVSVPIDSPGDNSLEGSPSGAIGYDFMGTSISF